jgi:hypothetical protein
MGDGFVNKTRYVSGIRKDIKRVVIEWAQRLCSERNCSGRLIRGNLRK